MAKATFLKILNDASELASDVSHYDDRLNKIDVNDVVQRDIESVSQSYHQKNDHLSDSAEKELAAFPLMIPDCSQDSRYVIQHNKTGQPN